MNKETPPPGETVGVESLCVELTRTTKSLEIWFGANDVDVHGVISTGVLNITSVRASENSLQYSLVGRRNSVSSITSWDCVTCTGVLSKVLRPHYVDENYRESIPVEKPGSSFLNELKTCLITHI